ncbi:hypothetical protein F5Y04DRAFT_269771 [Hypomontagnella monticulosa]|nr:hypothetical protein F5Y04DRAFT_269771 [Hypomontagnella monticulosa]
MDKPLDPLKSEFEEEAQKFKSSLGDVVYLDEILKITSIEGVYDITDKIQDSQHKCGELRYLSKIKIYLERLDGYVSMINGIIHESHDVLALLWGSIAVLLQLTGSLNKAYDSLIDVLARVGRVLPDFQTSASVFNQSIETRELLIFFFKDLLKIYGSALKFFSHTNWMHLFDHLWPQQHAYYLEVASHMDRLTRLMRTNIRIEDIQKEDEFRKEASENFKTQARKSHTQRFHHLITSFSPCRYDATLYRLDGLCYDGTGNWLFADKTFKQWRNSLEEGPRILWLKGIPGADGSIWRNCQPEAKTSALSTIHSLIFQLAGDDEDLMSIVCESMDDSIKSSLKAAGNVLSSLIHYVGSVYLLIDGVDEINEVERGRLVTELLRLIKECGTLRIIFSSRPEADLMRLLDNTAAVIHIHDHNEGSIGDYVNQRIEKYFHIRNILPKAKTEIKNLLTPLASRAKGMFLYARLIMDMATDIQDLSELQKELTILPESLDAAYHRIIMRLGSHEDKRRTEKAWRLLGWVACSTAPITVEEAHQALVIAPGNREQVFDMVAKLDVVELLGPIVETVDTYIRFVHFTAKEYVSSPHLGAQLIDKTQATLDLAMRCITYLCQHHHDPRLSSEELSRKVTTGQYSFHAFAMRMWFELICQYIQLIRPADPSAEFIKSMRMLRKFRKVQGPHNTMRDESDAENENWTDNESTLEALKRKQPLLYQVLRDVSRFRNSSFLFTGRTNQGPSKDINDPLSLSDMSRRIQLAFKYTMCDSPTGWLTSGEPGCHANCANILYYYGPRPFKCSFPGCEFWRHGFQGRSSRDKHEASHDTPLKCHVAGCQYEKIGFLSEKMRENHLRDAHKGKSAQLSFNLDNVTGDRVGAILLDFVRDNQVDAVHNILDASPNAIESDKTRFELRLSATSGDMLNLLEKPDERDKQDIISKEWVDCIRESIKQHNESTLEYFLSRITPFTNGNSLSIDSYKLLISLISELVPSNWTKGTEIWSRSIRTRWILAPSRDDKLTRIRELLGRHIIIKAASRSDGGQQLIRLWRDIEIDLLGGEWASQALKDVAEHGSITLAKYLLDNGANINHRRSASYPTALQRAAKRNTETNAKMIKFLLEFGADPDADQRATKLHYLRKSRPGKKIRDEAGAKGIHEWLGKSWDELAEETKNTRKT